MSRRTLPIILASALAMVATHVRAEIFVLTHGGQVVGQWMNPDGASRSTYKIALPGGGRLTLSADQVKRVIVKSEAEQLYEKTLPTVPDTVAGHLKIAAQCRKAHLTTQRALHLRRVLEIDPDNVVARRGLGYSLVDGNWIKANEWLEKQGYVRFKGSWRLPQEIELEARQERQAKEEIAWRKRVRLWRTAVVKRRDDAAQAIAQIRAIDSPLAITPLAELLNDREEPPQLKHVYVEVLGKFDSSAAAAALLRAVMEEQDLEVCERCIRQLQRRGRYQALAVLSRALKEKDNAVVNRAGWALGRLGDPEAISALIDAVVTTHKFKIMPGGRPGGINFSQGPGGSALQMGGRPKIISRELQNRSVLAALTTLAPDNANFGYNKQAWKNWYARRQIPDDFDLRRDQ